MLWNVFFFFLPPPPFCLITYGSVKLNYSENLDCKRFQSLRFDFLQLFDADPHLPSALLSFSFLSCPPFEKHIFTLSSSSNPSWLFWRCLYCSDIHIIVLYLLLPSTPTAQRVGCCAASNLHNSLGWHGLFGFPRTWQYGNAADLMDDCLKMAPCIRNRSRVGVGFFPSVLF